MSYIGEQLVSAAGFGPLSAKRIYHYIGRYGQTETVILVFFTEKPQKVHLERIPANDFEYGLENGNIVQAEKQATLPPWLSHYEGLDMAAVDAKTAKRRKRSLLESGEEHYQQIEFLLLKEQEILCSADPAQSINKLVRQHAKQLNEVRARTRFF